MTLGTNSLPAVDRSALFTMDRDEYPMLLPNLWRARPDYRSKAQHRHEPEVWASIVAGFVAVFASDRFSYHPLHLQHGIEGDCGI